MSSEMVRAKGCGCLGKADRYSVNSWKCKLHGNPGYQPLGREWVWLCIRFGYGKLGPIGLRVGAAALVLGVLTTPVWALAAVGEGEAAYFVGVGYFLAAVLTLIAFAIGQTNFD